MNFKLIQWNINGFLNNYTDLQLLINEKNPHFLSLQETHCNYLFNPVPPNGFSAYFCNSCNLTNKQGLGVFIKSNIPHKEIPINSNFQIIALEVTLNIKFTIISIPPSQSFTLIELINIFQNITTPLLFVGDVNGWSTLWGSPVNNTRGTLVEDAIVLSDLCILNNGQPTHFSTHNTFTHVDISCCSPSLYPICKWSITDDLHHSDHYPIVIDLDLNTGSQSKICYKTPPKFALEKADWEKFNKIISNELENRPFVKSSNKDAATMKKS